MLHFLHEYKENLRNAYCIYIFSFFLNVLRIFSKIILRNIFINTSIGRIIFIGE